MKVNYWYLVGSVVGLFLAGCGPEAETGAVFTRYSAHACAAPSPADTVAPARISHLGAEYLMGKFNPAQHPDFVAVGSPYTNRTGMYLRKEALAAFQKMWKAAQAEGLQLTIISAARNFDYQKNIWEKKWLKYAKAFPQPKTRALKILEYSAMPGASRHHWGTDIDLNDLNNGAFNRDGAHEKVYLWLVKHAAEYGFFQPYTAKNELRPNGYNEEKWHWSYRPLSEPLLREYEQSITDEQFAGFSGAETAPDIQVVKNFVSGIAK